MEFTILHKKSMGRTGKCNFIASKITDCSNIDSQRDLNETDGNLAGLANLIVETPNVITYTKYGRIPHLTADVEHYISMKGMPEMKKIRLSELMEESLLKSLNLSRQGYKKLTNSEANSIFFCSVQDSSKFSSKDICKYSEEKSISVWTSSGRRKVTPEEYMEAISISGIQLAEALCDVTPCGQSSKRIKKSVDRTLKHLDRCIEIKQSNENTNHVQLLGAIVGGDIIKERIRCAQETSKRNVQGFVLEGLDSTGSNFHELLRETLNVLPNDKLKILQGVFDPDQVIDAVSLGVDLIDNSYVFDVTSRGSALMFEFSVKRRKIRETGTFKFGKEDTRATADFEICLKEQRFKEDFRPVIEVCNCYTCLKYSRSYLNHLLTTNEMLAQVLLMIHNTHHFKCFADEMRKCVLDETLSSLKDQLKRTKI